MRGMLAALLFCLIGSTGATPGGETSGGEAPPPTFDFRVVERIELACRIGVEKAKNEEEALASLRWRNGALAAVVEITYQATMAWLSEREELAAALESGQGEWLNKLKALPAGTREQLDAAAKFLHRRLRTFMTMTTENFAAGGETPQEGQ